ncbi:hypothetical protein FA13DRAFT_1740173 [Coprinellus micaceus]|uniref:F-box domain-containing protein n=2 Tax=Coprinellus micaceus TaxID=71717 RepID=A0A4Y7SMU7_COPMI|nr:hypothetical protein FA13DRAFT_1740173 [Coprinellus micaceus]
MLSSSTRLILDLEKHVKPEVYLDLLRKHGAELEADLQVIRSSQNAYSLSSRLPNEVLEKIFLEHATNVYWDWEEDTKLRWFRVAQVCRRWREVAVSSAPLWSTIILSHPEFMKLMVARSKRMPLDFTLNTEDLKYIRRESKHRERLHSVAELLSQPARFRSLAFRIQKGGRYVALRELLRDALASNSRVDSIPPNFLTGGAPALRLLELERVAGKTLPTAAEFYTSFSTLNALQKLDIVNWLPVEPFQSSPIEISSLKSIEVEDNIAELTQFFCAIRVPSIIRTNVKIGDRDHQGPDVDRCIQAVRRAVDDAIKEYPEVLKIDIRNFDDEEDTGLHPSFQIWHRPGPQSSQETDIFLRIPTVHLEFKHHPASLHGIFASIVKGFDLTTAKGLDIALCRDVPSDLLLEVFAPLPKLERLTISYTPVCALFARMATDPALQPAQGDDMSDLKPYFPSLSSITLSSVDLEEDGTVEKEVVLRAIADALKGRPEGYSIEELRFELCLNDVEEDHEILRAMLPPSIDVIWDAFGQSDEMDPEGEEVSDSELA